MDKIPAAATAGTTAAASWVWMAPAIDVVQLLTGVVALAVGVLTFVYYWEKRKHLPKGEDK